MKMHEPITIRPLRIKGVFGITWQLYKRGFWPMAGHIFLFSGLISVFLLLACFSMFADIEPLIKYEFDFSGLSGLAAQGATPFDAVKFIFNFISFYLIAILVGIADLLLLQPIISGAIYSEMSARIYGQQSSLGELLRRTRFYLKRFFTTYLCHYVSYLGVSFIVSIITSVFTAAIFISAAFSALDGSAGDFTVRFIVLMAVIYIVILAIMLAGMVFLSFVFPITANENIKNFEAVKRSFKLVSKKYWRVLGANCIPGAVVTVPYILMGVMGVLLAINGVLSWTNAIMIYGLICIVGTCLLLPYFGALQTVLYFDVRTRVEGTGWLNQPDGSMYPQQTGSWES